jgi:diphthamide biosynthesis enzyme Dph1/Dph2-like protein
VRFGIIAGIVVATLGVSRYLEVVESLARRVAAAGKKAYTFAVGKINPAKLANFPEVKRLDCRMLYHEITTGLVLAG